ncbi:MAG: V-type ATP synthase subunit D [Candidatus Sumerlaeota bacterium]
MAKKIQKTKSALKAQRDSLERFERYLPTLELKKQQLRMEVRRVGRQLEEQRAGIDALLDEVSSWVGLFNEDVDLEGLVELREAHFSKGNIAGVSVPVFESAEFDRKDIDLYATPLWFDRGAEIMEEVIRRRLAAAALAESLNRLNEELRITSQRVNLFEKVKIPETRENISIINIALGDAQTAAVVRAKIAKKETVEVDTMSV